LKVKALGVSRIGATATVAILEEAKKRLGMEVDRAKAAIITSDGY
jgi:deoxyribose-phosphate aldolase